MIKSINHIAIVVPDLGEATGFWAEALGLPVARVASVPTEGVDTAFLPVGESNVELITPTLAASGVARYLEKRGPGIHHICFEVDDIEATLEKLRDKNVPLINEEPVDVPDTGHGSYRYAFVHPKGTGGVLIELYQMTNA